VKELDTVSALAQHIKDEGRTLSGVAKKAVFYGAPPTFDGAKLGAVFNRRRSLSATEFLAICKALQVSPDDFYFKREDSNE